MMLPLRHQAAVLRTLAVVWLVASAFVVAQKKDDDEIQKLKKGDSFTKQEPKKMKALGVERYGPFPWADNFSTTDIDKVLGPGRTLWMETAHFRIGMNLKTSRLPEASDQRKAVAAECKRLHKKCRKIPAKPKKIGPWLHMHLYAQRVEDAYTEFAGLVGVTDSTFDKGSKVIGKGPFLGLPDKHLLLLFQKKSDMARYMKRFCDTEADDSMRYFHHETGQMLLCVSAAGMEGFDAQGIHGHVTYAMWLNLVNSYKGHAYPVPMWFGNGIAHYYSRRIKTEFSNARVSDTESVDQDSQNKWIQKVYKRARHEGTLKPFVEINAIDDWDKFGFHDHMQAYSRIDFLMHLDSQKVGLMIDKLKSVPGGGDWTATGKRLQRMMPRLIFDLFEFDAETFDKEWRKWVLKTYPKRKD